MRGLMQFLVKIVLVLIFTISFSKAQIVFPMASDNPTWNVVTSSWSEYTTASVHYLYDTSFCNQSYSKMSFPYNVNGYFRNESLKTTFRKSTDCNDNEYLMYDYSLQIGDTSFVAYDFDLGLAKDTAPFVLSQIDTVNFLGVDRQVFTLNFDRCNTGTFVDQMTWIRGVGSSLHPFYSFFCICDACEYSYDLLCLDSAGTQLYKNQFYNTCDTSTSVGLIDASLAEIKAFPNPFLTQTHIGFDGIAPIDFRLYDLSGQTIELGRAEKDILIGNDLKSGIYFLEFHLDQATRTIKLLKL